MSTLPHIFNLSAVETFADGGLYTGLLEGRRVWAHQHQELSELQAQVEALKAAGLTMAPVLACGAGPPPWFATPQQGKRLTDALADAPSVTERLRLLAAALPLLCAWARLRRGPPLRLGAVELTLEGARVIDPLARGAEVTDTGVALQLAALALPLDVTLDEGDLSALDPDERRQLLHLTAVWGAALDGDLVGMSGQHWMPTSLLGEGADAVVYSAQSATGEAAALRLCKAADGPDALHARLAALVAAGLPFPRVLDAGEVKGRGFLVLAPVGRPLSGWLSEVSIGAREELAIELLYTLDQMKALGFRHGDLERRNLLVSPGGRLLLIDPVEGGVPDESGLEALLVAILGGDHPALRAPSPAVALRWLKWRRWRARGRASLRRVSAAIAAVALLSAGAAGARSLLEPDYPSVRVSLPSGELEVGAEEVDQSRWEALLDREAVVDCGTKDLGPTFPDSLRGPNLPVVCVRRCEAAAFANALSLSQGLEPVYLGDPACPDVERADLCADGWRLPSAEEAAAVAQWAWPEGLPADPCAVGNIADDGGLGPSLAAAPDPTRRWVRVDCKGAADGVAFTAPVEDARWEDGGLFHLGGNVREWLGGPCTGERCPMRGWSYLDVPDFVLNGGQPAMDTTAGPTPDLGFRLVRNGESPPTCAM